MVYYGQQPPAEEVAKIKAPLLLNYAGTDERINAGIPAFEDALKKSGKEYTLYMYDGAQHAFNNDTNEARYNKAAADLAWGRTLDFFKTTPGGLNAAGALVPADHDFVIGGSAGSARIAAFKQKPAVR